MSSTSPVVRPAGGGGAAPSQADTAAALEHFANGRPLDFALRQRVRTQAEQVTEEIRRQHGLVDDDTFQSLLDDEA